MVYGFSAIKKWWKGLDKNNDGVVDVADVSTFIKNAADVNNDGVVDRADVVAAIRKIKRAVKITKSQLNAMTKSAIQAYALDNGIELDRKLTKVKMIEAVLKKQK